MPSDQLGPLTGYVSSQGPYSLYNSAVLTLALRFTNKIFGSWWTSKSASPRVFLKPLPNPFVVLDTANVTGIIHNGVESFYGIPYAKPLLNRFGAPEPIDEYSTDFSATLKPPSCPQQASHWPGRRYSESAKYPESENCLVVNVQRPIGTKVSQRLPVLFFIFGGGFEAGQANDGAFALRRANALKSPMIYVSFNYRVSSLGFLGGREMQAAGASNLGIRDQRTALLWVQRYIESFGGDPTKITAWGESAGAISLGIHLVAEDGGNGGLFRAAVFTSGSPLMLDTMESAQAGYDAFTKKLDCNNTESFKCLQNLDFEKFKKAMDEEPTVMGYRGLKAPFMPRIDGDLIKESPQTALRKLGRTAIPIICGGNDDEGTLFSMASKNITTDDQFRQWVKEVWAPLSTNDTDLDELLRLYPNDVKRGSPFNTGTANAITSQYKRIAAFQGDIVFHAPRRHLLEMSSPFSQTYAYLNKRAKWRSVIGSSHKLRPTTELIDYIIHFTRTGHDPNGPGLPFWPEYSLQKNVLTFFDEDPNSTVTTDTFREPQMRFLNDFTRRHPL